MLPIGIVFLGTWNNCLTFVDPNLEFNNIIQFRFVFLLNFYDVLASMDIMLIQFQL